jgi:thiol-disulfide isomerase/thioredoxin
VEEENMRLPNRVARLGSVVALAALLASCSSEAPNFSLKTAKGETIELQDFQGKVVVINFWASWCPPCRAEIPGLQEVYRKYRPKGLEIVGISLDRDGWKAVSPLVRDMNIEYPVVLGDNDVANAYGGIRAIPTTIIVDRDGKIVDRVTGFLDRRQFEDEIREIINS